MPTYDYLCPNGHRFEVIHGVTADGPTACLVCGASPVRKAVSAPSIVFKGSGWAKKDRSTTSKPAAAASSSDGSSSGSSTKEGGPTADPKGDTAATGASGNKATEPSPSSGSSTAGSGAAAD